MTKTICLPRRDLFRLAFAELDQLSSEVKYYTVH